MKNINKKQIVTAFVAFGFLLGVTGPINTIQAQTVTMSSEERQARIVSLESEIKVLMQQLINILQVRINDLTLEMERQAEIRALEAQLRSLMFQLITVLQSRIAAYGLIPNFPVTGFAPQS